MEDILNNLNIQKLKLRAGEYIENEIIWGLRGTKALVLESIDNTDQEYNNREDWGELVVAARKRPFGAIKQINVTTWSSLVRNAIDILREQIDFTKSIVNSEEFRATFESCLNDIITRQEFKLNSNCPKRLYRIAEEDDLIHSSVYMNNKNHFIPIIKDEQGIEWGLCAVYTGEVIIMLEALLDTIHFMITEYRPDLKDKHTFTTFVLTYIDREDLIDGNHQMTIDEIEEVNNEIAGIDEETKKLEMAKDIIRVQGQLTKLTTMVQEMYAVTVDIQEKYDLPTLDDILKK